MSSVKVKTENFENPWDDQEKEVKHSSKTQERKDNKNPLNLDGNVKFILLIVIVLPLLAWLSTGFYTVNPDQEGVIVRFGKYHSTTQPGLRYKFPDPIDKVIKISVTTINRELIGARIQSSSDFVNRTTDDKNKVNIPEESQMLSGDENIIDMHFFVQWRIKNAYNYVFKTRDSMDSNTLRLSAESAMREVIGRVKLNDAISEQRQDIEKQVKIILQKMLDEYQTGIEVVNLGILYSYVPSEVKDAYRDIQAAKADKEREINQAYAYRNDILPKARGTVFTILEEAKGRKEAIISEAKGHANKFNSVRSEYQLAPEVTKKRIYIDTMESILSEKNKILMSKGVTGSALPLLSLPNLDNQK